MEEECKKKLFMNIESLVADLKVKFIQDELFAKGVLSPENIEQLDTDKITSQEAVRKLVIKILPKKGPGTFDVFIQALNNNGYDFLADKILSTDTSQYSDLSGNDEIDAYVMDDKLEIMQHQLRFQTQLLMQYQSENKKLLLEKTNSEDRNEKLKSLDNELTKRMEETGLRESNIIDFFFEFLKNKDKNLTVQAQVKKSSPDLYPGPGDKSRAEEISKRLTLIGDSVSSDTEIRLRSLFPDPIAAEIARDIILFMTSQVEPEPINKYALIMRKCVNHLYTKNSDVFEKSVQKLLVDKASTGYELLFTVADNLFSHGEPNWGKIVALYAFCGWSAKFFVQDGNDTMVEFIAEFLAYYVAEKIGPWIRANGGWVNIKVFDSLYDVN